MRVLRSVAVAALLCLLTPPVVGQGGATKKGKTGSIKAKMTDPMHLVSGKDLEEWIREMSDRDPSKRTLAVLAIPSFGPDSQLAVPALLNRLRDGDVSPRVRAVMVLRAVAVADEDAPKVVTALANRLAGQDREPQTATRYEITLTLGRFIKEGGPAIPALARAVQTETGSWEVRHQCVQLLWRIARDPQNGPDPRAVKALLAASQNEYVHLCKLEILQGLGALGKPTDPSLAAKVQHALGNAARSTTKAYALWGLVGLVQFDPQNAEPSLKAIAKYLKSPNAETRNQAAQALGLLGDKAKSRVPDLLDLLDDRASPVAYGACAGLASIGDASPKVVAALVALLEHKDPIRVSGAAQALAVLKVNTPQVTGALEKLLKREDKDADRLRDVVRSSLEQIRKGK
jgi:HEAT repeat protein